MAEDDTEFNEIISSNFDVEQSQDEFSSITIKDLHEFISTFSEAILFMTDFIQSYYKAVEDDENPDDYPAMGQDSVFYLKTAFEKARDFCDSVSEDDDEDDEESDTDD